MLQNFDEVDSGSVPLVSSISKRSHNDFVDGR